ncbi:MAG: pantetheine-phosphate adenylyltransferase [Candidatus Thermoplasmatota archaeon]|nr:pantetheine-phosphate adenylyltransferase [Candidatus Thermoplasmatota archaeon]MCL5955062.1 pantetheine-phosphate adenylyltransferase [Candidatus Thermoplasmatota archaeon]
MITVLGGTFSKLHKGHRLMLKYAFNTGNRVVVGLTTDEYLKHNKTYGGFSYSIRKRSLERYMSKLGNDFEVLPLETRSGNTETSPDYAVIVVSKETRGSAESINRKRLSNGLKPLEIITVPVILAEDLFPLSSTRIIAGEINPSGKRLRPVRIGISTANELKANATEAYIATIMRNFRVEINKGYDLETNQPFGDETYRMAVKRAISALIDRDYGIGIESGIFRESISNKCFDIHVCAVIDRYSRITIGTSSGFEIPDDIITLLKDGQEESKAFETLYGVDAIGKHNGIIGAFTDGHLKRKELVLESVRNAFVPRIGAGFFGLDQKL